MMRSLLLLLVLTACSTPAPEPKAEEKPVAEKPAAAVDVPAPADVAAPPADATVTPSGLAYKVQTAGTGTQRPLEADSVEVNYTGWTTDGKMFDSSAKRKKPAKFKVKNAMKGWTEGFQLMVVGDKTRFWIPENLAYAGKPGKPAGMLVYDVELVSITEGPKPIPAPEDVAAAPSDAKKTKTGLAYKIITKGDGKEHPKADSYVEVDYTGWTSATGEMFDSSVARGKPASFALNRVIAGWTEGVQLMVVGDKARFWIPADLAYGETPKRPGAPSGQLTFDIELKAIKEAPAKRPAALTPGQAPKIGPKSALKPGAGEKAGSSEKTLKPSN